MSMEQQDVLIIPGEVIMHFGGIFVSGRKSSSRPIILWGNES